MHTRPVHCLVIFSVSTWFQLNLQPFQARVYNLIQATFGQYGPWMGHCLGTQDPDGLGLGTDAACRRQRVFLTLLAHLWLLIMLVGLWLSIYTGCTKCHLDLSKVVDHGSEPNNLSVGLRCEHLFQQKCNEPRRRLVKNLLKETQMLDECKKILICFCQIDFFARNGFL